mgnify:CR=1 FL=1
MQPTKLNGYSLLEALAAIAIVGMALLAAANALQSHAALTRRTEVRQQMLEAAEEVLEAVRGEVVLLDTGPVATPYASDREVGIDVHTSLRVTPRDIEGLYEVAVVARSRFLAESMELELVTMVWRP